MMPLSRKVSDVFILFPSERVNRAVTSLEVDKASDACPLRSCCNISTWNGIVFLRILSPDYLDGADFTPGAKTGS